MVESGEIKQQVSTIPGDSITIINECCKRALANTIINECCKRALANTSRHVFAFAQKYQSVIEEANNLQCA